MFIVTIFVLTGAATGYTLWFQDLYIDGKVETGELDWKFVTPLFVVDQICPESFGYYPLPPPPLLWYEWRDFNCDPNNGFINGWGPTQYDPVYYPDPKNVACGSMEIINDHELKVWFTDTYPGYWNGVTTHVKAIGTIPVKIQVVYVSSTPGGSGDLAIIGDSNDNEIFEFDLDGDGCKETQLKWGNNFGEQLDPCQSDKEISFQFCFLQCLKPNESYTIYLTFRACQWNEYFDPTEA